MSSCSLSSISLPATSSSCASVIKGVVAAGSEPFVSCCLSFRNFSSSWAISSSLLELNKMCVVILLCDVVGRQHGPSFHRRIVAVVHGLVVVNVENASAGLIRHSPTTTTTRRNHKRQLIRSLDAFMVVSKVMAALDFSLAL